MRTRRGRKVLVLASVGLTVAVAAPPRLTSAASPSPSCGAGISTLRAGSASAPELTIFESAIEIAGLGEMLERDDITILTPNDAAFEKIPTNVLNAILADTELLTSILNYHVLNHSMSAADLAEAGTASTLDGADLRFAFDGELLTINGYEATVVCADMARAGATVHVIDSLLLPRMPDLVEGAPTSGPTTAPTTIAPPTTAPPTTAPPTTAPPTTQTPTTGSVSPSSGVVTTTTDPGAPSTSIAGSTSSLSPAGGGTLPASGSSSAQTTARAAVVLLVLGAVVVAVTLRRRQA